MSLRIWQTVSLLLVGVFCNLGFVNCSRFVSGTSMSSVLSTQSQCKAERSPASNPKVAVPTSVVYDVAMTCNDPSHYNCDERDFRPHLANAESELRVCTSTTIGQVCLDLKITAFDTSPNLKLHDLPVGAFSEGGEFNHVEVHCSNNDLKVQDRVLFEAESSTLDQALNAVIAKCQTRSL